MSTARAGSEGAHTSAATASYESEASAHRLLAQEGSGFDSARLGRHARELERRAGRDDFGGGAGGVARSAMGRVEEEKKDGIEGYSGGGDLGGAASAPSDFDDHPLSDLRGSSLRQILDGHHEHCVRTALRQSRERTVRAARARVEERIKGDWEAARAEVLGRGVLGSRFLVGAGGGGSGAAPSGTVVASRVPLLEGGEGDYAASSGGALTIAGGARPSPYANIVPSPQSLPPGSEGLVRSHLAAVEKHLTSVAPSNAAMVLLASLQESLKDPAATANLSPESMNGYSNAYALVRSIVDCAASLGVDLTSSDANSGVDAGVDGDFAAAARVMGTCNFFARQFATHVSETVQEAELGGMLPPSSSLGGLASSTARDICSFATIAAGRDVVEGRGGVWPRLFYCLRCGDLNAANSVIKQFGSVGGGGTEDSGFVDPSVSDIVSQLAALQDTQETIFGDSTNGSTRPVSRLANSLLNPSPSLLQSRRQVADLYERARTRLQSSEAASESYACYRTACLAMLGGTESISEAATLEASGLVKTVEDYLYASLWHALHLADAPSSLPSPGSGGGLRKVATAVARLSALVNQWGPAYFEQDEDLSENGASAAVAFAAQGGAVGGMGTSGAASSRKVPRSGGWAFALPLLASQQYATALASLAEAGAGLGLLQAAHVGIVMDVAGLSISDFALDQQPSQQALLPMIVASYSASLQGLDAGAALKYLVLLSKKGKFVKEQAQRLILETRQFEVLAGRIEASGTRSNGALDAYFSKKEVSSLLVDSANHAIRVGKPADAAELLALSGRFGALFSLMNRELASYLNASTEEDFAKRQFWFNAASEFHRIHLAQGRTYVQTTLDSEGSMALGNTFQLLMNLVIFFDRCRENQWESAWMLMNDLQLIPKTESEMTLKVEAFRALDNCVRQVFHTVVIASMEALCHIFRSMKQSGASASFDQRNTIDQRLNELRMRARLLVTFARLLNLPSLGDSDTYVRMSQLEKNMM